MKIYVAHSKRLKNYKENLYIPIRNSRLNDIHEIKLPHEFSEEPYSSKEFIKTCDLLIAEITETGTGLGIEIGWTDAMEKPIIYTYRKGIKISESVKSMEGYFLEYNNSDELITGLESRILDIKYK